jgi:hypothetical protein
MCAYVFDSFFAESQSRFAFGPVSHSLHLFSPVHCYLIVRQNLNLVLKLLLNHHVTVLRSEFPRILIGQYLIKKEPKTNFCTRKGEVEGSRDTVQHVSASRDDMAWSRRDTVGFQRGLHCLPTHTCKPSWKPYQDATARAVSFPGSESHRRV